MKQYLRWSFPVRLLAALCASAVLLFAVDLTVPADEAKIYDRVIRLHILANSVGIDTASGKVFTGRKYRFRLKLLEWFSCFIE